MFVSCRAIQPQGEGTVARVGVGGSTFQSPRNFEATTPEPPRRPSPRPSQLSSNFATSHPSSLPAYSPLTSRQDAAAAIDSSRSPAPQRPIVHPSPRPPSNHLQQPATATACRSQWLVHRTCTSQASTLQSAQLRSPSLDDWSGRRPEAPREHHPFAIRSPRHEEGHDEHVRGEEARSLHCSST